MELSPRPSRSSSTSSRNKANLTLDLTNLPPLILPTPPSNTLLFTNLNNVDIFQQKNLDVIRNLIAQTVSIHAFAPLKSFRRIIMSFYSVETALAVRKIWDGEAILGERVKVYFGHPTPVEYKSPHLELPDAGKLFFISPPPSPPHGWEMKLEDAPNKLVHADDLAEALARLHSGSNDMAVDSPLTPNSAIDGRTRSRSSTLIYQPDLGSSPGLPAVFVEDMDMTDEPEEMSPSDSSRPIKAHTSRPPVELMLDV